VVRADLRFRQIFEASPDAILQVDRLGRIVLANSLAGEMFRCRLDELLGKSVDEFVPAVFAAGIRGIASITRPSRPCGPWDPAWICGPGAPTAASSRWTSL
jgi:PAS domain S-box-containing protein